VVAVVRRRTYDTLVKLMNRLMLTVLCCCWMASCRKTPVAQTGVSPEQIVAEIDTVKITIDDLDKKVAKLPLSVREQLRTSPGRRKSLVDGSVRFEILAQEAARHGYDKDPEVVQAHKEQMVNQLIRHEMNEQFKPENVPDAEAQKYYETHFSEYNRAEQVRVSDVLVKTLTEAMRVVAEAKSLGPHNGEGFRELVEEHSIDARTKGQGGDLGAIDRNSKLPRALVDAAFALAPGAISGPIKTDEGFHVLKCQERIAASTRPFQAVKAEIQSRLAAGARAKAMDVWFAQVKSSHQVHIFEDRLAKVGQRP
jgi:peptidyl-prolyl cis-trans isomerase C